jgi:hypothetical protein
MSKLLYFSAKPDAFRDSTLCEELRSTSTESTARQAMRKRAEVMENKPSEEGGSDVAASVFVNDPLLCKVDLPLRNVYYPLGFAVELVTNSAVILHAASESWGHLHRRHAHPALQIRVGVMEGGPAKCPPSPTFRAQQHLLSIVADAHNQALCDLKAGFAFAWFNDGALYHPTYLRYHFLEAIAFILISGSCAIPLHAACVSLRGRGILLCGESGTGKSTLAYACARNGWTFISDDGSYLERGTETPRVLGNSHRIRFRPAAKELFPELKGRDLTPRAEGKPSIEVPTAELPGIVTAEETAVHSIVFLKRQASSFAALRTLPREVALQYFQKNLYPIGEAQQTQSAMAQYVSTLDVYELVYQDLQQAVDCLELLSGDQANRAR